MVRFLAIASAALAAATAVSGYVVPRTTPPIGWITAIMENYDVYHTRYMALDCQNKHNTDFFTACCHPLKANETLATARAPKCNPANHASTPSSASTASGSSDDDGECDDGGDDEPTSVAHAPTQAPEPSEPATTSHAPKPTTTEKPTSTAAPPKPQPTSTSVPSGGNWLTGGEATFFDQDNTAGSCGIVHADTDKVVAVQQQRMEKSLCGKQVMIVNTANGKSVVASVADTCPTCQNNPNSLDLSHGAFDAIADEATGVVPIKWMFI